MPFVISKSWRFANLAIISLLLLMLFAQGAFGQQKKSPQIKWKKIAKGFEYASVESSGKSEFRLQAIKINLAEFSIHASDARSFENKQKRATAKEMAAHEQATLAINASFFDENYRPLGLVISDGKRINPFRKADWGVLYVKDKRAKLIHTKDWAADPVKDVDFALQVGPRLVVKKKPTKLKPQIARRAVICILSAGSELIVAVTDRGQAEANELAELMAKKASLGGFQCESALMMDGGPSSQLYANIDDFTLDIKGSWPVPIGIVFRGIIQKK